MEKDNSNFELVATKSKTLTYVLGELKFKAGDHAWLIDEENVYVKIKNTSGNIGFAPFSMFTKADQNVVPAEGLIFITIFPYQKREKDELDIQLGELVKVKAVADDGWCYAQSKNKFGWIPCNRITPIYNECKRKPSIRMSKSTDDDADIPLDEKQKLEKKHIMTLLRPYLGYEWFFSKTSIGDCQNLLRDQGSLGDYLIRVRNDLASLSIMVLTDDGVKNFIIEVIDDMFVFGNYSNSSLNNVIEHFTQEPLGLCDCGYSIILKKPIRRSIT